MCALDGGGRKACLDFRVVLHGLQGDATTRSTCLAWHPAENALNMSASRHRARSRAGLDGRQSTGRTQDPKMSNRKTRPKQQAPTHQEFNTLMAMFSQGRYLEAENLGRTLSNRFPRNGMCWSVLGAVLKLRGRTGDALAAMRKAAALSPNMPEVHFNLGIILSESGNFDDAEGCYRRALAINPDYAEAHNNLGRTLQEMGRTEEAEASFRRALQIKPQDVLAHDNLGRILQQLGRPQEAEASFRRALQIDPNHVDSLLHLGNILSDLGPAQEAEACYRRALQIRPDFIQAHYGLGILAMKHGLYDPAIAQFERVIALDPTRDSAKIDLCQAIYMLSAGDPEKAKDLACKARELHPQDPIVLRGTAGMVGETRITTDETTYTRKLFDGFAQTFESKLGELDYSTPKYLAHELGLGTGQFAHKLDVLDAGCGTGLCGTYLRPVARTLVGVDLSPGMLRLAKEKNLYDALHEGGINEFLRQHVRAFDLIVFADVLVYFGELLDVIESSFRSLRQEGRIAISAECIEPGASGESFVLQASGRYAHSPNYIRQLFEHIGFSIERFTFCTLRMENEKPILGCIVVASKP